MILSRHNPGADRVAVANPAWNGDTPDPGSSKAPYKLYNIGNNNPVELLYLIEFWRAASVGRRSNAFCRCNPAMCLPPSRM